MGASPLLSLALADVAERIATLFRLDATPDTQTFAHENATLTTHTPSKHNAPLEKLVRLTTTSGHHHVVAFSAHDSLVPHLFLSIGPTVYGDAAKHRNHENADDAEPQTNFFCCDLISKVPLITAHDDYIEHMYGALSGPHTTAMPRLAEGALARATDSLQVASPWMLSIALDDSKAAPAIGQALSAYVSSWLLLHKSCPRIGHAPWVSDLYLGSEDDLKASDARVRSILFSADSWAHLDAELGAEASEAIRKCFQAQLSPSASVPTEPAAVAHEPTTRQRRVNTLPSVTENPMAPETKRLAADGAQRRPHMARSFTFQNRRKPSVFSEPTSLSLSSKQLSSVPLPELVDDSVRRLSLSNNSLTSVPFDDLGRTSKENLDELSLYNNKLREIPKGLPHLTNLTVLSLDLNMLTELPDKLCELTNLRKLSLFFNRVKRISPSIRQLRQLKSLLLQHNDLASIPAELGELPELTELSITHNRLKEAPFLPRLVKLEQVGLSNNKLTSLPTNLDALTNLSSIGLARNELTSLPPSLLALPSLVLLNASSNRIGPSLPPAPSATKLAWLDLQHNQLAQLPRRYALLPQLDTVLLNGNPLPEELLVAASTSTARLRKFIANDSQGEVAPSQLGLTIAGVAATETRALQTVARGLFPEASLDASAVAAADLVALSTRLGHQLVHARICYSSAASAFAKGGESALLILVLPESVDDAALCDTLGQAPKGVTIVLVLGEEEAGRRRAEAIRDAWSTRLPQLKVLSSESGAGDDVRAVVNDAAAAVLAEAPPEPKLALAVLSTLRAEASPVPIA